MPRRMHQKSRAFLRRYCHCKAPAGASPFAPPRDGFNALAQNMAAHGRLKCKGFIALRHGGLYIIVSDQRHDQRLARHRLGRHHMMALMGHAVDIGRAAEAGAPSPRGIAISSWRRALISFMAAAARLAAKILKKAEWHCREDAAAGMSSGLRLHANRRQVNISPASHFASTGRACLIMALQQAGRARRAACGLLANRRPLSSILGSLSTSPGRNICGRRPCS